MVSRAEERRKGRVRLIGLGEDDGAFDREFWRAVPPARRLEQVWEMVEQYQAWSAMPPNPDFRDLFSALNAASANLRSAPRVRRASR